MLCVGFYNRDRRKVAYVIRRSGRTFVEDASLHQLLPSGSLGHGQQPPFWPFMSIRYIAQAVQIVAHGKIAAYKLCMYK